MNKGLHVTLLAGPLLPVPVSPRVLEALVNVQVTTSIDTASGFQLQFELSNRSPLHTEFILAGGSTHPVFRIVVAATLNGITTVLVDGVVTQHQAAPQSSGGTLITITGEDLTRLMDYEELSGFPFPAMPPFARVATILAKYAPLGIKPRVIPNVSSLLSSPLEKIPQQQGTDLQYVRMLAQRAGYRFYLDFGSQPGRSTAYWGPLPKHGKVQPSLNTNMDAHTNVEALNFSFDGDRATNPIAFIQEPFTKATIPVPIGDLNFLNPSLGAVVPLAKRFDLLKSTAKLPLSEAIEQALAHKSNGANSVMGSGRLDVAHYGRVLEPRKLVGVRGAGRAFDGVYFVENVTHHVSRGRFTQDFTLSRNALVSQQERLPA